jgi:aminopeptidase N
LAQLKYIIGEENFEATLKRYFKDWAFKHPTPNDFIRSAEKTSGLELEWFLTDWTQTVNTIDYAIKGVSLLGSKTEITLERIGLMPMPVEVEVLLKGGKKLNFYIPLQMMRGEKPTDGDVRLLGDWAWAYPIYRFEIRVPGSKIKTITIDVKNETADVNKENNQKTLL